jgi:ubiquinone biosynthesis protein
MAGLSSYLRLIGVGWTLARADALLPRELDPVLPGGVRGLAGFLRLFAGGAARLGRPGERLALALERSGPVAIKTGQFLSTRADIFGVAFAEDLGRLKDRLPPFDTALAKAEVALALGRPLETLFSRFDDAIAGASLAQAHPAVLTDGRAVAVKVLRPGIERRVAADTEVMALAASLVERWVPAARRLEPRAFAAIVARALTLELDLRFEAAGADELRQVMADDGNMTAPPVVWDGVARRVLTLEWAPGMALSDAASLEQPGLERRRLADNLIRAFLAQALDHGVFHADLHEGNLFVAAPARITAVDFGIVGRLGPGERRYLAEILWGFLQRDYPRVAAVHFDAGYVPAHHDCAAFAQALRAVGEPVFGRHAGELSMGRLLAQLFEITALFDMRLRPELVLLQKTMVTVEGVARRIDPQHDIWAAAEPVVRRWITRELSPAVKVRAFAEDARAAIGAMARLAQAPSAVVVQAPAETGGMSAWTGAAIGIAAAALVYVLSAWLHWAWIRG